MNPSGTSRSFSNVVPGPKLMALSSIVALSSMNEARDSTLSGSMKRPPDWPDRETGCGGGGGGGGGGGMVEKHYLLEDFCSYI